MRFIMKPLKKLEAVHETLIHATIKFYTDPVLKIISTQPVFCPHGHVNDKRVLDLAFSVHGYYRCNHQNCHVRIQNSMINSSHEQYVKNWYHSCGNRFSLTTIEQVNRESKKRLKHLEDTLHLEKERVNKQDFEFELENDGLPPQFMNGLLFAIMVCAIAYIFQISSDNP